MNISRSCIIFLAALSCIVVAIIFQIVGLSSVGWVRFDSELGDFNDGMIGLWKACNDRGCMDIPLVPAWLGAVRAFGILATLACITCLAAMVTSFFVRRFKIIGLLTPIAAVVAACFELLEVAIFGGMTGSRIENSSKHSFSYCLPLTVIALILSVVASVVFFVGQKMDDGSSNDEKREKTAAPDTKKTTGGRPSRFLRMKMTLTSMFQQKI